MSTFNYNQPFEYQKESGIFNAPSLLSGGVGGSFNFGAQVERSIYAATAGGAGRFAFGTLDTPQRNVVDWKFGWDPTIGDKPDPNFTRETASHLFEKVLPQESVAAILYRGGEELKKDLIENSVSQAHFFQRAQEIEVITRAELEIDRYDAESNFLTYGFNKTFSAAVNYIFSDPTTAVSFIATGGMAAAGRAASAASAAAAAGTNVSRTMSVGSTIANLSTNYSKSYKAATYLWDGLDGASSAYSSWDQMNDDGYRIYGKTYTADKSWTDDVAFGAMLGLGFAIGGDLLNRGNKANSNVSGLSALENMAANSEEGTLGTAIDYVAQSAWRESKSRLERSLDTITGPDTELRRLLMDDEARAGAHWGTRQDMDDLSDWIETNRPDAAELNQYVSDRLTAALRTQETVAAWRGEVETYVLNGGDQAHFYRKKAVDFLRSHMGEDFAQYRFIVDYLEEASGDPRLVAEWMARGDKDRVVRVANAINANARVSILEDTAVNAALTRVRERGYAAAADEAVQAMNRVNDNITQGRFQGGVDILNEMHTEAATRTGNMIASVDGAINQLNDAFVRLNDEGFERLDHFKEMINALKRVRDAAQESARRGEATRARTMRAMDPDADNATVLTAATEIIDDNPMMTAQLSDAVDELNKAATAFRTADAALSDTLDEVKRTRREILAKGGVDALDRTMEESGTFPLWKVSLSQSGFDAVRRSAVRQTQAANRWKVEFVDRFLGTNSADNHLNAGTNPLRPVLRERRPIQRMTVAEQETALAEELAKVAPEIEAIRAASKDLPLDQKIGNLRGGLSQLNEGLAKMREAAEKANAMGASRKIRDAYKDAIAKRERLIKRTGNLVDRLDAQLNGQLETLNRDLEPTTIISADTVRAERAAATIAANDKAAKKLAELKPEEMHTKKGRNIRNKARKAAAQVGNHTEYSVLRRETELVDVELAPKRAELEDLLGKNTTDADPRVVNLRDEISYLEKRRNKIASEMATIEGRPAMIRRSHVLGSNNPSVEDVVEISRLRAQIGVAVQRGDTEFAEELNRRLYNLYGDATRLPRWTALEDFFIARQTDALNGKPTEDLLTATMDGRNVRFSVASRVTEDVAVRTGVDDVIGDLPTRPDMPSGKGIRVPTEGTKKAVKDMRDQQMLEAAVESDPETAAARSAQNARTVSYVNSAVTDPTVSAPSAPTATAGAGGKTAKPASPGGKGTKAPSKKEVKEAEAAEKHKRIIDKLRPKDSPGERLLIMNNIMMRMGQVPVLRGLGRALFSLQAAGTGFADIHNSSRVLDLMVTAFNMLDRPETLIKSLGFNNGAVRTMQNFRDRGRLAVNELAVAEVRARNAGHYRGRPDEDQLLQDALDSGDTTGLNAGMRQMYDVMRRHYDEAGQRLAVSHGAGIVRPNYRPREANGAAIMARMNEAQGNFRDVYANRIMTSGDPLPDALADRFGVPRGTAFNVLSAADQAAFRAGVEEYANEMASHTISRLTAGITEDGVGYRIATNRTDSAAARTLEDAVYRDPRVRQYYIGSPVQEHKLYMEIRAPQIMFDAQLSEMMGERVNFDEVIEALYAHGNTILDSQVKSEYQHGIDLLRQKWMYNTGRAQYIHKKFLDPAFRISTGIVRGSFGAMWGMAGVATEMTRVVAASRMYGGGIRGMFDLMHAIRNSNNLEVMEDIAHATDQYSSIAHSSFGSSVGTTMAQRFIAPWERVYHVALGRESVTNGGTAMSRGTGTAVALAEAYGETGMRLSGMQWASGVVRITADRQAKRFITRNIDNMDRLATALEAIGAVSENTPQARQAFRNAAAGAGIPWDVALQMNHSGLLVPDVIRNLRNGLAGQEDVWSMGAMRGRVDDRTMSAVMDYLTAAHNQHVPTASLATSVESKDVFSKLAYNLTSYSRAFAMNVAFRSIANGSRMTALSTIAAVMIGENLYQSTRDVITGKKSVEDLESEWNENPAAFFMKNAIKSPWLGAHNATAVSVMDQIAGGSAGASMRGNNALAPIMQSLSQLSRLLFSDEKTGERDLKFLNTHTPLFNTWYSQLITSGLE